MTSKKDLTKQLLLTSGNFHIINKDITKIIGILPSFFLSALAEGERLADKEGWFFQTVELVEEQTGLSKYQQLKAINKLKDFGILEQENKGQPMKRYFRLNAENILNILANSQAKNLPTNRQKTRQLKSKKLDNCIYKEIIDKEINKEITITPFENGEKNINLNVDLKAKELAQLLASLIKRNYDFLIIKEKQVLSWAKDIEKIHKLDKYDYTLIENVIKWSQEDNFWKQNIKSGAKLRKQFNELLVRIKTNYNKKRVLEL